MTVSASRSPAPFELVASFVAGVAPGSEARARAAAAVMDTIGVALAGSAETAARIVQRTFEPRGPSDLRTLGPPDE